MSLFSSSIESPSPDTLRYWLALWRTPGIGPIRFFQLLDVFPQLEALFSAPSTILDKLGLPAASIVAIKKPDWTAVERELRWAESPGQHIVSYADPCYPALLKQIVAPPPLLLVQGNPGWLNTPQLAIVGSRNPSPHGIDTARQFAQQLAQTGLVVTSGLALGIDAVSHHSVLAAGHPTIAVLGSGLDRIYPARHRALAEQVAANGALVSEHLLGTPPIAENFPRRNRIVSGLSLGVLVVEATLRSGSLITARLAAEQGREVFAIPGSIHNPLARGCHALIRQGAKLVETVADILEELPQLAALTAVDVPVNKVSPAASLSLSTEHQQVLAALGYEGISIDQLVEHTGLSAGVVAAGLFMLELDGQAVQMGGGYLLAPSKI